MWKQLNVSVHVNASNTYTRPLKTSEPGSQPPKKPERLSLPKGSNCSLKERGDSNWERTEMELQEREPSSDKLVSKMRTVSSVLFNHHPQIQTAVLFA